MLPEMRAVWETHGKVSVSLSLCHIIQVSMQLVELKLPLPGVLCVFVTPFSVHQSGLVLLMFIWAVAIQIWLRCALLVPSSVPT